MLLAEPPATAYDLNFRLWDISVRISPFFWVAALLLGWELAAAMDRKARSVAEMGAGSELAWLAETNPGQGVLLIVWVAAVFVSILVHELGHAIAMRRFGVGAHIVLYHFGGLAVPDSMGRFVQFGGYSRPGQQIIVSAAGPAFQLALAAVLIIALKLSGTAILFPLGLPFVDSAISLNQGQQITSFPLQAAVYFLLLPSVFWALVNLLPVYPLDGGQIAREILTIFNPRDGLRISLMVSVVAGAGVAGYALMNRTYFLGIMFAILAFSSYQILQAYSGRGGFGGPR